MVISISPSENVQIDVGFLAAVKSIAKQPAVLIIFRELILEVIVGLLEMILHGDTISTYPHLTIAIISQDKLTVV